MILTGKPTNSEKTCPSATLSTTNPTWIDRGVNPGLRGKRSVTIRLSHSTAAQGSLRGGSGSLPGQSVWDLWWAKCHLDRLFSEFFGFLVSILLLRGSLCSYMMWGMNNMPVGDCGSLRQSHPIGMNMNIMNLIFCIASKGKPSSTDRYGVNGGSKEPISRTFVCGEHKITDMKK
jgi:hypothetical protein